jgi:hypothetical protein
MVVWMDVGMVVGVVGMATIFSIVGGYYFLHF